MPALCASATRERRAFSWSRPSVGWATAFSITVVSTAISERLRGVTAPEARPASIVLVKSHSTPSSPMRPRQRLSEEG